MFILNLLNKIPFFFNWRLKRLRTKLGKVKKDYDDGNYNDVFALSLHKIINNALINFSDVDFKNSLTRIRLSTKSSVNALKLLDEKILSVPTLEKRNLINIEPIECYYSEWHSNDDSLNEFIEGMKYYIGVNYLLMTTIYHSQKLVLDNTIEDGELLDILEFLDSLLYRLLVTDVVNILTCYLETKYGPEK